jgi:molybdopterin converting factor subunit 1
MSAGADHQQSVRIRLFARARELAGAESVLVEITPSSTVGELRRRLMAEQPGLAGLIERSALAVNMEFAADSAPVPPGAEIALLPPVSGGTA